MSAFFPSYRERADYPPKPSFRSPGRPIGGSQRAARHRGEGGATAADPANTPFWTEAAHQDRIAASRATEAAAAETDREALVAAERKLERELR